MIRPELDERKASMVVTALLAFARSRAGNAARLQGLGLRAEAAAERAAALEYDSLAVEIQNVPSEPPTADTCAGDLYKRMAPGLHCIGCGKTPDELDEYVQSAAELDVTPEHYVRTEEGTFNAKNEHFACTDCYVKFGCPRAPGPRGWVAP